MSRRKIVDLYADGGVIKKNPSTIGGTYAFVLVWKGQELESESGVLTPKAMGKPAVTNNQMELYAVMCGVAWARDEGLKIEHIYSDSQVTLGRLYKNWKLNGIPLWMEISFNVLKYDIHKTRGVYVRGHNGDKWNEMCDQLCRQEAENFLSSCSKKDMID